MNLSVPKEITTLPTDLDAYPVNKNHADAGLVVSGLAMNEAWVELLRYLLLYGEESAPRGQKILETRPAVIRLDSPRKAILSIPERFLNYTFMVAEWVWIVTGRNDVEMIAYYNKKIADFSDDGRTFFGAYGPRFVAQLQRVIDTLRADPDSRQAWIQVWREPPPEGTKDVPCTLGWQFFIRNGRLEMHAHMRSSDVWLGLPYDAFNFSMIQLGIAAELGLPVGPTTFMLGSSHLYRQNLQSARDIVQKYAFTNAPFPVGPFLPGLPGLCFDEPVWTERAARDHGEVMHPHHEVRDHTLVWDMFREVLAYRNHRDATQLEGLFAPLIRHQEALRYG